MPSHREVHRIGLAYLEAATALLQRVRSTRPTAGLYEAADLQWWWRMPRATDGVPQLLWLDHLDHPVAAAIATEWGDRIALDPIVMPDASPDWFAHVMERGLTHAAGLGFENVSLEADGADDTRRDVLAGLSFEIEGDGLVETWLAAEARPAISPLHDGYRLSSRLETMQRPHHMITPGRNHPDVERRLRQTSLYRPDLDLVVHDDHGDIAAYGLFWYDPATATGLVEPMRTEVDHQRRGLARHVLTCGIDFLVEAGAERIKVCYELDNPAARDLYLGVGFEPDRQTVVYSRRPSEAISPPRTTPIP